MTVVATGHQPNLLPGISVVNKIRTADIFIACDEFQFVRHGFVNRNRLSDGTWLTAPVDSRDLFGPINRVRLAEQPARWREKVARTIEQRLSLDEYAAEFRKPWRMLVGLNVALLRRLLDDLEIATPWVFQSHLESGKHFGPLVTDDHDQLLAVSERLALMTAEVGADVWLSGPSGRNYLDERPFRERGIDVVYFDHVGPNASAVELVRERVPV